MKRRRPVFRKKGVAGSLGTYSPDTQRQILAMLGYDMDAVGIIRVRMETFTIFIDVEHQNADGSWGWHEDVLYDECLDAAASSKVPAQ